MRFFDDVNIDFLEENSVFHSEYCGKEAFQQASLGENDSDFAYVLLKS